MTEIVPLGNLNPPDHTLPTNHIYLFHLPVESVVSAPAAGRVTEARRGVDDAVYVQATPDVMYYFGHLRLDPGIVTGSTVVSGQRIGVTVTNGSALDLGLSNAAVTRTFVRPDRYIPMTLHADAPLKYFPEPTRTALYAKVSVEGDKDGRIDFDRQGRLAGNWFVEGLAPSDTERVTNGPKQLAFVRNVRDQSRLQVSIGGTVTTAGAYFLQAPALDPDLVEPGQGPVAYGLLTDADRPETRRAWLLVELLAEDRLRAEAFPAAATVSTLAFSAAATIYTR